MMPETNTVELTVPELSLLIDIISQGALGYSEKADRFCEDYDFGKARSSLETLRRLVAINQKMLAALSGNPYENLPVRRERLVSELGLFTQSELGAASPS